MSLSKESQKLMSFFLDDFGKYSYQKSKQKEVDIIFKNIFNELMISNKMYKTSYKKNTKREVKEILGEKDIMDCGSLLNSGYIIPEIRQYIITKSKELLIVKNKIQGVNVTLYFLLFENTGNLEKYNAYIDDIFIFLNFILGFMKEKRIDSLTYCLYLTHFKKTLPDNLGNILSPQHCNTGVTMGCVKNGEILIFREEEWFKVLIHETFHSLCLDFNNMHLEKFNGKIRNLININSQYNLFESYTETWACILNSCFSSLKLIEYKSNLKDFLLYLDFCLHFERIFSLFQCVKVLDHMGLKYKNIVNNTSSNNSLKILFYKENTNVFAYYIVKCILLYYKDDFILWCVKNNVDNIFNFLKSEENLDSFFHLIESLHYKYDLMNDMKIAYNLLMKTKKGYIKNKRNILTDTLKMTIVNVKN
tara:strand:- start:2280 stop:3536 length:1257 start_codon:yes stop_codon:yes gene_type:complete